MMFRKTTFLFVFFALIANYAVFSQTTTIDAALLNATSEISKSIPKGTKIAVLNISSDYAKLSDYIIDELISNLVNTRLFQVVPRNTVELELAKRELDFQYTGNVSDESQKSLGKFLGADTIISGSVARDSANSYRIVVNAIDLESFTYQSSYRVSVLDDSQVKALIAGSGGVFYEDYTTGQRLGMGALNIFVGIGSIIQGQRVGWVTTGFEAGGLLMILIAASEINSENDEENINFMNGIMGTGAAFIGIGVVIGFIIPFFHHKPDNTIISENNNRFPFSFELVSTDNRKINGVKLRYNIKF